MLIRDDDTIKELLDTNIYVVVQFGSSSSIPSKQLKMRTSLMSLRNPDILFVYLDIEDAQDFRLHSKVVDVPTTVGYRNGSEVERVVGNNEAAVKQLVEKVRTKL